MIRRIVGLLLLLLGLAGLTLSAVGIWATWQVRVEAAERAEKVATRAEELLTLATSNLRDAEKLLQQARKALHEFRETAQTKAPAGPVPSGVQGFLLKKFAGEFAPNLDDANRTLNVALDAAVVINAVLEGADTLPLTKLTTIDSGQLRDLSDNLKDTIGSARDLSNLLHNVAGPSADDVAAATAKINEGLTRAAAQLDDLANRAASTRDRVVEVRAELPGWLLTAAFGMTAFLSWFALGQLCLAIRGGTWLFRRGATV